MRCLQTKNNGRMEKMTNENELINVPHQILKEAEKAGIEPQEKGRSGTFFHLDQSTIFLSSSVSICG